MTLRLVSISKWLRIETRITAFSYADREQSYTPEGPMCNLLDHINYVHTFIMTRWSNIVNRKPPFSVELVGWLSNHTSVLVLSWCKQNITASINTNDFVIVVLYWSIFEWSTVCSISQLLVPYCQYLYYGFCLFANHKLKLRWENKPRT